MSDIHDTIKKLKSLSATEGYAGGDDVAHAESYLDYIDELVMKLDDKKIAYEIQNAADDLRKHLGIDPTNIRTKFEGKSVSKNQISEGNLGDMAVEAEKDHEVQMARSDCFKSASYAIAIHKMLKDVSELEGIDGWIAAKITKAADYLGSVKHYMEGEAMKNAELALAVTNAPAEPEPMQMDMPEESVEVKKEKQVQEAVQTSFDFWGKK